MNKLIELIEKSKNIAITGHVSPDGDCTGSTLGLYNYITENYKDKQVRVCLEKPSMKFSYMNGFELISENPFMEADLVVSLDASDRERLGSRGVLLDIAKESLCIDHHITNTDFAKFNIVEDFRSSTCELLYTLLEKEKVSVNTAICLYTGIFEGKCCYGVLDFDTWSKYISDKKKMDGIIDNLRNINGVEIALFMYETEKNEYKVSLRSINKNVSTIAAALGGGGHIRAAGATVYGNADEILKDKILPMIEKELNG